MALYTTKTIKNKTPSLIPLGLMTHLFLTNLLLTNLGLATPPVPPEIRPPVILSLGEQRLLHLPGLKRYSLGAPLLRVLPSPASQKDALLLKATKAGITDLWVWKSDGTSEHRTIEIRAWKTGPVTELEKRISELNQVEVLIRGKPGKRGATYLVHGTVTDAHEAQRLGRLRKSHPEAVQTQIRIADPLFSETKRKLEAWVEKSKWKDHIDVETDAALGMIQVRGATPDPKSKIHLERAIREIAPLAEIEIESLPDRNPTIHFKVFLLELRKNHSRSLGVDLPGLIPNALRASSLGIHSSLSIEAAIQALESDGAAKILSKPELAVRAPGEAELFAGGEIPIETKTIYSSKIDWRSHGLSLKLKVGNVAGKRVRVDVQTEVSHLGSTASSERAPRVHANRMKTQVDAEFGTPLLLSGLLQEGTKQAVRGLPYLKDLPLIGALFGSQDFIENRSELVAVLLPSREVPQAPSSSVGIDTPTGRAPLPRNWISPEEEVALRSSPDFPWNAFEEGMESSTEVQP